MINYKQIHDDKLNLKSSVSYLIAFLTLLVLFSESVWAGSMRCGTYLISDGKKPGPSKAEVKRKCGYPYSESGNRWIYYKGSSVYRLRFSEVSGLVSVKREIRR